MNQGPIQLRDALWAIFKDLHREGYRVVSLPRVRDLLRQRLGRDPGDFVHLALTTSGCYATVQTAACHGVRHFLLTPRVPAELKRIGWPDFGDQEEK